MAEANIPYKYWYLTTEDDYVGEGKPKEKVMAYINKLDQAKEKGIGLYLAGSNGVGKTMFGCEILKAALRKGYTAKFFMMDEIVSMLTDSWYDEKARAKFHNEILNVDFLYIDDSGKEFKSKTSTLVDSTFDKMFRNRANELLPTIISSNEKPEGGTQTYGQSVLSLFYEHLIIVTFRGKDYRKENISPDLEKDLFA